MPAYLIPEGYYRTNPYPGIRNPQAATYNGYDYGGMSKNGYYNGYYNGNGMSPNRNNMDMMFQCTTLEGGGFICNRPEMNR